MTSSDSHIPSARWKIIAEVRFITDSDYDPTTQKKPLLNLRTIRVDGHIKVHVQEFQACDGWISSLLRGSYKIIPHSLYDSWRRGELTSEQFLEQATAMAIPT